MPELHPFPAHYHLPYGEVSTLPVTRDGIRSLMPFPFVRHDRRAFPKLEITSYQDGAVAKGICGLMDASCFTDGTIRPHEETLSPRLERQRGMVTLDSAALGKPILLTVKSLSEWWSRQSLQYTDKELVFHGSHNRYSLIPSTEAGNTLSLDLAGELVIADGHHRASTHARLAAEGKDKFSKIPVVIVGADELQIGTFLRIIEPEGRSVEVLLEKLEPFFAIEELVDPEAVTEIGKWLLSFEDRHFHLTRRMEGVTDTDPGWFNRHVLPPVFGITDMRSDPRIISVDPPQLEDGLLPMPAGLSDKIKLIGRPITREKFFTEVESGRTLPPKSTRFEPRVPSGLLVWVPD